MGTVLFFNCLLPFFYSEKIEPSPNLSMFARSELRSRREGREENGAKNLLGVRTFPKIIDGRYRKGEARLFSGLLDSLFFPPIFYFFRGDADSD
jgi:hypothetical protein